jgi:hypothetical protein
MVLGMLVLVFLIMFHPENGRLIDRVGDIEVSKEKVEIKTVQTVLGNTQLSSVVVAPPMPSRGIQGTTHVNPQEGFQLAGASQLPPADQLGTKLREDLLSTLNSFRFLASA